MKNNSLISDLNELDIIGHIYIFGHSLDVTDKDILKELIESQITTIAIFYHDKKIYARQISNLVKILRYENLISMTQGPDKSIIFKQQSMNSAI